VVVDCAAHAIVELHCIARHDVQEILCLRHGQCRSL